jgi:signal transduction histidine kinase
MARDVTEEKAQEEIRRRSQVLEEQNRSIQEANRLKSEFLANMSHELRTPLNAVIGFSEILIDEKTGAINPAQREYLNDIWTSGKHLLQLINDVLDLAKVEAGKMELNPQTFSVKAAIAEGCAIIKAAALKKNIALHIEAPPEDLVATLDPLRFKQVLYNLLSNAVKFTPDNGVVTLTVSRDDDQQIRLQVQDTGIGIKKEDLPRLFHEFEQLDSGLDRREQGTGLGLALTRKFVELQHGSITVESEFGKGSTFMVVLPAVTGK